jgi:hypothetical protein
LDIYGPNSGGSEINQDNTKGRSTSATSHHSSPERRWMHFSDEKAEVVTLDEVLSSEAYMLFYDKMETQ